MLGDIPPPTAAEAESLLLAFLRFAPHPVTAVDAAEAYCAAHPHCTQFEARTAFLGAARRLIQAGTLAVRKGSNADNSKKFLVFATDAIPTNSKPAKGSTNGN